MSSESLNPTYAEFMDRLYSIHPIGNAELYYDQLLSLLDKQTQMYDGSIMTFESFIKRYSDYMSYLKPFNATADKQFIKKDMIPKGIGEYILLKLYMNDYAKQQGSPNDIYLYWI